MKDTTLAALSRAPGIKFVSLGIAQLDEYKNYIGDRFSFPSKSRLIIDPDGLEIYTDGWLLFRVKIDDPSSEPVDPAIIMGIYTDSPESKAAILSPIGNGYYAAIYYYHKGETFKALRLSRRAIEVGSPKVEVARILPALAKVANVARLLQMTFLEKDQSVETIIADLKNYAQLTAKDTKRLLQYAKETVGGVRSLVDPEKDSGTVSEYTKWRNKYCAISSDAALKARELSEAFPITPKFSIIMPIYRTNELYLREAVASISNQIYSNWELLLIDDGSGQQSITELLERFNSAEARVRIIQRTANMGVSYSTNEGIDASVGDYVVFVDHDDFLEPDALFWIADAVNRDPEAALIYTDEDKSDEFGELYSPHFKPDWNPLMFLSFNYINHLTAVKRDVAFEVKLRSEFDGAQDYDFLLRYIEKIDQSHIVHVPRVLYHWRAIAGSTALSTDAKEQIDERTRDLTQEFLDRNFPGSVVVRKNNTNRVHFKLPDPAPSVAVIVPTRDGYDLLKESLGSLMTITDYPNYQIFVIDNQTTDKKTLDYLADLEAQNKIKVIHYDKKFNFSAMHNAAIGSIDADLLLLLNNDTSIVKANWLSEMVSLMDKFDSKIVGARLLYGDGTTQHAGVMVGMGGAAGHYGQDVTQEEPGYRNRYRVVHNLTAVTGACLLIDKKTYLEVGGMNEEELPVAFNDVELCIKVVDAGHRVAWTPFAVLIHHESKSRGSDNDDPWKIVRIQGEQSYLKLKWPDYILDDPNYNPNMDIMGATFQLAKKPRYPTLAEFVDLHFDWEKKALSVRDPLLKLDAERARNLRHAYGLRIARNLREARSNSDPIY